MPLSEKTRIEVYLPDLPLPAYQKLLEALRREFTHSFGGSTMMATWLVGIAVPPHDVQLASFTYTALAQDVGSSNVGEQMKLLERCILGAKYEVALEDPEPPQKKAWWRRGR